MISARQRPIFQCSHCLETFGFPVEIDHKGVIIVTCPFCGKTSKADLDPYRERQTGVYRRGEGKTVDLASGTFVFPATIPTEPADKKIDT